MVLRSFIPLICLLLILPACTVLKEKRALNRCTQLVEEGVMIPNCIHRQMEGESVYKIMKDHIIAEQNSETDGQQTERKALRKMLPSLMRSGQPIPDTPALQSVIMEQQQRQAPRTRQTPITPRPVQPPGYPGQMPAVPPASPPAYPSGTLQPYPANPGYPAAAPITPPPPYSPSRVITETKPYSPPPSSQGW